MSESTQDSPKGLDLRILHLSAKFDPEKKKPTLSEVFMASREQMEGKNLSLRYLDKDRDIVVQSQIEWADYDTDGKIIIKTKDDQQFERIREFEGNDRNYRYNVCGENELWFPGKSSDQYKEWYCIHDGPIPNVNLEFLE